MAAKRKYQDGKGPLTLIEEVFHLLRRAPLSMLGCYYIGALPFVIALLYFWADMSKSGLADQSLPRSALALAILFAWMKAWQSIYARGLWDLVQAAPPKPLRVSRVLSLAGRQLMLQPTGLFILPLALLSVLPFPRVYAFYQNLTALDDGEEDMKLLTRRASDLSGLWPRQNLILIWALSPYLIMVAAGLYLVIMPAAKASAPEWTSSLLAFYSAIFALAALPLAPFAVSVAANIATAILILPKLLKTLLGVQTVFAANPGLMLNSAFFAVVCGLTYLCLDPLVKAAYVLRCFQGESLRTGEDLLVELRRFAAKAALVILVLAAAMLCSGNAFARKHSHPKRVGEKTPASVAPTAPVKEQAKPPQPPVKLKLAPQELNRALDRVLAGRKYAWRLPRDRSEQMREEGVVSAFLRSIFESVADGIRTVGRWIKKAINWLKRLLPEPEQEPARPEGPGSLGELGTVLNLLLYLLLAVILSSAAVILYRIYRRRGPGTAAVKAEILAARPDLEDETVSAADLPEDKWLAYARELASAGELRLAIRAVFLAGIAALSSKKLIALAPGKTNRDYQRELKRRAHAEPVLPEIFAASVLVFEAVWYGTAATTRELYERAIMNQERLRAGGQQQ